MMPGLPSARATLEATKAAVVAVPTPKVETADHSWEPPSPWSSGSADTAAKVAAAKPTAKIVSIRGAADRLSQSIAAFFASPSKPDCDGTTAKEQAVT